MNITLESLGLKLQEEPHFANIQAARLEVVGELINNPGFQHLVRKIANHQCPYNDTTYDGVLADTEYLQAEVLYDLRGIRTQSGANAIEESIAFSLLLEEACKPTS